MVRPSLRTKNGLVISLYMVMVREYMGEGWTAEKQIKASIKDAGGSINQSGLFLSATSNDVNVTQKSSVNRRSVAFIPRTKISKETLAMFDEGTYMVM